MRRRTMRQAVRAGVIVIVLCVMLAAIGFIYTWYMSRHRVAKQDPIPENISTGPLVKKPSTPSPDSPIGTSLTSLTTPIKPGENAMIMIKTLATAECTISVKYNNVESKDSGLIRKKADDYGIVKWSWTVDATAPEGRWPIDMMCYYRDRSSYLQAQLDVKK